MITNDGNVNIIDFGVAKFLNSEPITRHGEPVDTSKLTIVGTTVGTPIFSSPELANAEEVDYRSDYFSLGSILYWMLSGRKPFRGLSSQEALKKVRAANPWDIKHLVPGIPKNIEGLVKKLMKKEPAQRPQSIDEILSYLEPKRKSLLQSLNSLIYGNKDAKSPGE